MSIIVEVRAKKPTPQDSSLVGSGAPGRVVAAGADDHKEFRTMTQEQPRVRVARIRDARAATDGVRVVWPRGLTTQARPEMISHQDAARRAGVGMSGR